MFRDCTRLARQPNKNKTGKNQDENFATQRRVLTKGIRWTARGPLRTKNPSAAVAKSEGGGETKRSDLLNAVEEKQSVKNQPVNQQQD